MYNLNLVKIMSIPTIKAELISAYSANDFIAQRVHKINLVKHIVQSKQVKK